MRLIDADALKDFISRQLAMTASTAVVMNAKDFFESIVDNAPTIYPKDGCEYWDGESGFCALHRPADDVPDRKVGKWIKNEGRYGWHCSACGEDDLYAFVWNRDKGENEQQDRYCPNCGAQMERIKE